jgi:hypothetical protein
MGFSPLLIMANSANCYFSIHFKCGFGRLQPISFFTQISQHKKYSMACMCGKRIHKMKHKTPPCGQRFMFVDRV